MFVPVLHILAIMGIALDRSKWRSVISPKIAIIFFLSLTPFGLENIDPRSPKLLTKKFTGVPFRLPSLVTLALIESEIAGRGRICPPPFPERVLNYMLKCWTHSTDNVGDLKPVRRHVWRCTSEPERDKSVFGVVSISRLSRFRDNETGDARANVQSPQLRLL